MGKKKDRARNVKGGENWRKREEVRSTGLNFM
jgi:hypothetical protein